MDINLISTAFGNKKQVTIVFYGGLLKNRHISMIKNMLEQSCNVIVNRIINVSSHSTEGKVRIYEHPYSQPEKFVKKTIKECSASKWLYQTDAFAIIPVSLSRVSAEGLNSLILPLFENKDVGLVLGRCEVEESKTLWGSLAANQLSAYKVISKNYDITNTPLCMVAGIYSIKNSSFVRKLPLHMLVAKVFLYKRISKVKPKINYTTSLFGYTLPDCSFTQFYQQYKDIQKLEKHSDRYFQLTRLFLEFIANPLSIVVYTLFRIIQLLEFTLLRVNKATKPQQMPSRRLSFQV